METHTHIQTHTEHGGLHTHTHPYYSSDLLRALLDPLALLVPLVKMVLVDSVVTLVPLVPLESRVWLDHLVWLEREDPLESLVLL